MSDATRIAMAVALMWRDGPTVFGSDWSQVRTQLLRELEVLDAPGNANASLDSLLRVVDNYPTARDELVRVLASLPVAEKGSYEGLPGDQSLISSYRFACPDPDCDVRWVRRIAGQRPGSCPRHRLPLIPFPEGV
jgi:hypothetical protein